MQTAPLRPPQEIMETNLSEEQVGNKSFVVKITVDNKTAGEAYFFEKPDEPGVFGGRVDIKERFRGKGLATLALKEGDNIIRTKFPNAKRRFKDTKKLTYKTYTDGIKDEQIIDIDENGILFKP